MINAAFSQGYYEAREYAKICDDADEIRKALMGEDEDFNEGVDQFIKRHLEKIKSGTSCKRCGSLARYKSNRTCYHCHNTGVGARGRTKEERLTAKATRSKLIETNY